MIVRREVSRSGGRVDERRDAEDVGRTRVVVWVVERRRGISSRPMLPEAEVMRMDLGGIGFSFFSCFFGMVELGNELCSADTSLFGQEAVVMALQGRWRMVPFIF